MSIILSKHKHSNRGTSIFVDRARIYVSSGRGGDGAMSFRREKYVPLGGPDGGSGGKGGDVIIRASKNISTLLDFKYKPVYKAEDGHKGESSDRTGACGKDLIIDVPAGTVIYKNGRFLADLVSDGETVVAAKGGRGGRGNKSFKSHSNTAPRIYEKGQPPEKAVLELELKLIADIGIIGHPNAGKSSLLARLTSARPKIASYPFTTIAPNLGVAKIKGVDITLADIPGLIEGARQGKGLGIDFLRHIERTRILLHIVDGAGTSFDGKTPLENYKIVFDEIESYSSEIVKRPTIVVFNKMDLPHARRNLASFRRAFGKNKVVAVSAVTGEGLEELKKEMLSVLKETSREESRAKNITAGFPHIYSSHHHHESAEVTRFVYEKPFTIEKISDGVWAVKGRKIEDLAAMTDFENEETFARFQRIIKKIGVDDALKANGAMPGDTVRISGYEFEYS